MDLLEGIKHDLSSTYIYQKSFAGNIFIVIFHANPWKEANAKAVSKRILEY
jgi:hypothetical protein